MDSDQQVTEIAEQMRTQKESSSMSIGLDKPQSKFKICKYKRESDSKLQLKSWLQFFDIQATFFKWDEKEKIVNLGQYLEGEVLDFFINHCSRPSMTWTQICNSLISRFDSKTSNPLIECFEFKYRGNMEVYYDHKKELGYRAELNENQIINLMIYGLPEDMRQPFISKVPQSVEEFYEIACRAEVESRYKREQKPFVRQEYKRKMNDTRRSEPPKKNPKKKPPSPCLKRLGFKQRYHWSWDCRNRKNSDGASTSQKQSNTSKPKDLN